MRARHLEMPPGAGAEYGLRHGLVGIGPGPDPRAERLVAGFAKAPTGAFVWTRLTDGTLRLGRLTGDLREHAAPPASDSAGLTHVRDADWRDVPVPEDDVPAAVLATFARGGRNFQRIRDPAAERLTAALWAALRG